MTYVKKRPGRPSTHPWDRWLDGHDKPLFPKVPGVTSWDYDPSVVKVESLRIQILQMARRRGIDVRTSINDAGMLGLRFPDAAASRRVDVPVSRPAAAGEPTPARVQLHPDVIVDAQDLEPDDGDLDDPTLWGES